jgi:hypothetical protein
MTTTDTNDAIDWEACWSLATQLAARTRMLIVERDYEGAREWALQMASAHTNASPANGTRAISYFELAVLLGPREGGSGGRTARLGCAAGEGVGLAALREGEG